MGARDTTILVEDVTHDHRLRVTVTCDLTQTLGALIKEFPAEWQEFCENHRGWSYERLLSEFARESGHIFAEAERFPHGWHTETEVAVDPPKRLPASEGTS